MEINIDKYHDLLVDRQIKKVAYSTLKDFNQWKIDLKDAFNVVFKIDDIKNHLNGNRYIFEYEEEFENFTLTRFIVETEIDSFIPCHLLIPKMQKEKYPLAITLQGHDNDHIYNANGLMKKPEEYSYTPYGELALACVERGYATLCVEMRGMGELHRPSRRGRAKVRCGFASFQSMLLGRCLSGERVWDVSKVIDVMDRFPQVDLDNIIAIGHSSGAGNIAYYLGAFDERIKLTVSSSGFCNYKDSIFDSWQCLCNYIPDVVNWFEMDDLVGLIAPRKLLIVTSSEDERLPLDSVKKSFAKIEEIFAKSNNAEGCKLIVNDGERKLNMDSIFAGIEELTKK